MHFTVHSFMKLLLILQLFVNNSCTKFHENPTNGLVTDTRSQTDGQIWSPHEVFFSS